MVNKNERVHNATALGGVGCLDLFMYYYKRRVWMCRESTRGLCRVPKSCAFKEGGGISVWGELCYWHGQCLRKREVLRSANTISCWL